MAAIVPTGIAVIALLTTALPLRADVSTSSRNLAQVLFDQARELMSAGRYAEACQKFGESQRLDPGGGTLLNLALCHEKEGKLATAWTDFREALDAARRDRRGEREKLAREHIEGLEPRLPRLTVRMAPANASARAEVMLDGILVNPSAWGTAVPVDPGEHAIEARAPGKKKWTAKVTLRDAEQVALVVPALEDDPRSSASPGSTSPGSTSSSPSDGTRSSGRQTGAYVLGGFGIVALGVGTYFGVVAIGQSKDAESNGCSGDSCKLSTGFEQNNNAVRNAWISDAAISVGLVATGVAAYWLLTSPRAPASAASSSAATRRDPFPLAVTPLADHSGAFAAWRSVW